MKKLVKMVFYVISWFSAFVSFHTCLVHVFIIVSSEELSRSGMFWVFIKTMKNLAEKILISCAIQNFIKLPNIMLKLLLHTFTLSKSYIVMKFSIKLVSHWVIYFGITNCKYLYDNLQAIFYIV